MRFELTQPLGNGFTDRRDSPTSPLPDIKFLVPTNEACQCRTSFPTLKAGVLTSLGLFTLIGFTTLELI